MTKHLDDTSNKFRARLALAGPARGKYAKIGLFLCALACAQAAWPALNQNHNSLKALSKVYGFLLGQEYSLAKIEATYPALRMQVEVARLTFGASFAGVREKLEQELLEAMGDTNFRKVRGELESKITQLLGRQSMTVGLATEFLEKVKARAKGGDMEVDVLRYLLAVKYSQTPAAEFSDGFRQRFSTEGSNKAQGIMLKIQLPRSWLAQDGERPHIVKKWANEGGTGLSMILLDIRDAEGQNPTTREVEQFVNSGEARQTFTDLGKVYDVGTFSLERRTGYWGELSMIQERAGKRMYQRGMLYQLFFRGKAIGIMCLAGAGEREFQKGDAAASLLKPVCQQVLNSLVLDQAY